MLTKRDTGFQNGFEQHNCFIICYIIQLTSRRFVNFMHNEENNTNRNRAGTNQAIIHTVMINQAAHLSKIFRMTKMSIIAIHLAVTEIINTGSQFVIPFLSFVENP
jgi:hypothetical protein